MIKVATVCTGIGSPEVAIEELGIEHEITFACDIDKYARASYLSHFTPQQMFTDMTAESWIGGGGYYSDLFIGGIPCQAFSLAGKRLGELDKRGLLFYDYYRYVAAQRPKVFIIENVKGLLSDNSGKTFQNWLLLLGDSVNHHHQMFNHPDSLGYNLHWTVLNAKDFGLPQNRERVFIIGIRPDLPNDFRFPPGFRLTTKLKDILQPPNEVDEKYYLSDKMLNYLNTRKDNFNNGKINYKTADDVASCINASSKSIDISDNIIVESGGSPVIIDNNNGTAETRDIATCLDANYAKGMDNHAQRSFVLSNADVLVSKERRTDEAKAQRRETGTNDFRGKQITFEPSDVMNCLQTGLTNDHLIIQPELNQIGNIYDNDAEAGRVYDADGLARSIKATNGGAGAATGLYSVNDTVKQLNDSKESGGVQPYKQNRIFDGIDHISPALDTECGRPAYLIEESKKTLPEGFIELIPDGDNMVAKVKEATKKGFVIAKEGDSINIDYPESQERRGRLGDGVANTLQTHQNQVTLVKDDNKKYRIRKLTPLECWRLQGFPDAYFYEAKFEAIVRAVDTIALHKNSGKLDNDKAVKGMSDSQLYKQAGNSMASKVMKAIIKNLLPILIK